MPQPDVPLTPALAEARFTSERQKQRRVTEAYASGVRALVRGLVGLAGFGLGAYAAPPGWWYAVAAVGVLGGLLVAFGLLRIGAAFLLSRRGPA